MTDRIWYAAYGSNLDAERFRCYIEGGRADGGRITHRGCSDPTPPTADLPLTLPYRLYFAGHSVTWAGSPAYLQHTVVPDAATLARGYLITLEQFGEILAQENAGVSLVGDLPLDALVANGGGTVIAAAYGHVLCSGAVDGIPILTCTSPNPRRWPGRPSANYLATMAKGISASHGLSDHEIAKYLAGLTPTVLTEDEPTDVALSIDFALDDDFDDEPELLDLLDGYTDEDCLIDGDHHGDAWLVSRFLEATQ